MASKLESFLVSQLQARTAECPYTSFMTWKTTDQAQRSRVYFEIPAAVLREIVEWAEIHSPAGEPLTRVVSVEYGVDIAL